VYEGFGIPALEAMACGVPVVVSNATSLPEIVGEDGMMIEPLDVDAWRDTIAGLLENKQLRADLASRGLARAAGFSWDHTAEQTVMSYRAALSSEVNA
jgi:glycosyltransferase involved in cell wall biosynthesis